MTTRHKHKYENVLVHSTDAFWSEEFYLGKRCKQCGLIKKGKLPMDGFRFLTAEEVLDRYEDLPIIEDIEHFSAQHSYGSVSSLGVKYSLWWEPVTEQWDGYVIRNFEGDVVKSWIVKEVK